MFNIKYIIIWFGSVFVSSVHLNLPPNENRIKFFFQFVSFVHTPSSHKETVANEYLYFNPF